MRGGGGQYHGRGTSCGVSTLGEMDYGKTLHTAFLHFKDDMHNREHVVLMHTHALNMHESIPFPVTMETLQFTR